jgi:hypothetical protein
LAGRTDAAFAVLMVVLTPDRHPLKAASVGVIFSDAAPGRIAA